MQNATKTYHLEHLGGLGPEMVQNDTKTGHAAIFQQLLPKVLGLPSLFKQPLPRVWGLPSIFQQPFRRFGPSKFLQITPFRGYGVSQASFNNPFGGFWAFQASNNPSEAPPKLTSNNPSERTDFKKRVSQGDIISPAAAFLRPASKTVGRVG